MAEFPKRFQRADKPRTWSGKVPHAKALERQIQSLTPEQQEISKDYTRFSKGKQADWQVVNRKQREFEPLAPEESAAQEKLRQAIEAAPPLPRVTTIHRGLAMGSDTAMDEMLSAMSLAAETGEPFAFRSNGSGSLNPERALQYATKEGTVPLLFEIKAKTGIYLQEITTQKPDYEILQADFVRYNVVRVQRAVPYGREGRLVTVIQLQEL